MSKLKKIVKGKVYKYGEEYSTLSMSENRSSRKFTNTASKFSKKYKVQSPVRVSNSVEPAKRPQTSKYNSKYSYKSRKIKIQESFSNRKKTANQAINSRYLNSTKMSIKSIRGKNRGYLNILKNQEIDSPIPSAMGTKSKPDTEISIKQSSVKMNNL